jgi:hypothetical protein
VNRGFCHIHQRDTRLPLSVSTQVLRRVFLLLMERPLPSADLGGGRIEGAISNADHELYRSIHNLSSRASCGGAALASV